MNIDVIIDERLIKSALAKVAESKTSSTEDDDGSMTVSPVRTSVISEGERKSFVSSSQQPKTASSSRSGSFIVKSTTTTTNNNEDNAQTSDVDEFVKLQHQQSSTMTQMCRICHSDSQTEDMIVPCKCSGSLKYVHQACLQNWLKINGSKSCEICKDEFIIKMRPNALNRWKKPIMTRDQRRKFLLMNFLYLVAILCNLWSINSFSGVLLMQFRLGIYDWKFYMIVFFSLSTLFCIIWFLVSLVQIWFDFFRKCFRYNQSMTIRSKFAN